MADRNEPEGTGEDAAPAPKPKRIKVPKPSGGSPPVGAIVGWALAIAAIAVAFIFFNKYTALNKALQEAAGPQPRGAAGEQAGAGADTEPVNIDDWQADAQEVVYDIGKFTANTADGGAAQLNVSLLMSSYYREFEWQAYSAEQKNYEEQLKLYLEQKAGIGKEDEKKSKEEHACGPAGVVVAAYSPTLAQHGAPKEEAPALLEPPVEPLRPLTRMEVELKKQDAKVRDIINEQISLRTKADLVSEAGRRQFKQAIIDALSEAIEPHYGTILDVYLKEIVTV